MNKFTRKEMLSLFIIFFVLIVVSIPNFLASLRRARDQIRRDEIGTMVHVLDQYYVDLGVFPPSSTDGKIMDCLKPGDKPYQDKKGNWIFDPIPCEWGKDAFANLITGQKYLEILPQDPQWSQGASYYYTSDGQRFQIFAAMEGMNEAEVDTHVIAEGFHCGVRICNMGRSYGCDIPKTLNQCEIDALTAKK